ncbi:hypothetical protein AB6A40_003200 [Gnathostoma spinigerum]|uniref:Cationic amino acid transporter C-terminal domain-containing protein n=1 Tax=Gnathostoma spinigerum TaxID=75299 RepID=A0ABD6EA44_9BILA
MSWPLPKSLGADEYLAESYDGIAMVVILCCSSILFCSLRVAGTLSLIFLVVATLSLTSTLVVGMFHANPENWLAAGFFRDGEKGVFAGGAHLLCAYIGVEGLTYLLEETHSPRRRIPILLPILTVVFTLFIFLATMVFTLSANISRFPSEMLMPEIYRILNVPAAKYVMTVGSVCGLLGSVLVVYLPGTRLLSSMSADRILPIGILAHTSKKRGIPYYAVIMVAIAALLLLVFKKESLIDIVSLNTTIRYTVMAYLTYVEHFRSDPIGLFRETSRYRSIGKKRFFMARSSGYSLNSSEVAPMAKGISRNSIDEMDSDEDSQSNSDYLINYFAQQEAAKLQIRLDEKMEKLFERDDVVKEDLNGVQINRSVFSSLDSFEMNNYGHNCIKSACSLKDTANSADSKNLKGKVFHLYERSIPDIPYYGEFYARQCDSPMHQQICERRARIVLYIFVVFAFACGLLILKTDGGMRAGPIIYLFVALSASLVGLALYIGAQRTNDSFSRRKCKTPGFPYVTLISIFILILFLCSASILTLLKTTAWSILGCIVYVVYGCGHSEQKRQSVGEVVITNEFIDDSKVIAYEVESSTDVSSAHQPSWS